MEIQEKQGANDASLEQQFPGDLNLVKIQQYCLKDNSVAFILHQTFTQGGQNMAGKVGIKH